MRPAKMITVRSPGRLFDVIGSRLGRPDRSPFRHTIPIRNSFIPSAYCKTSVILLSHHPRPPSSNIALCRRTFSTSSTMSSQPETSPSITGTTKADTMDVDPANVIGLGYETWYPTILALRGAVRAAFPSSPRPTPTSSKGEILEFNTYWRGVFENLHKQVESDGSIPRFLATPPLKKFEINIFTENSGLDCPCCLPDIEPANIILENEDGLTKGDLILGVGKYLYGLDLDPTSSLVVNGTGGVDETAGRLLPVIHSEYEITIKPAYPPYLVKEGDRERTLEQELANEHRPLGGWPMGGGSFSDLEVVSEVGRGREPEPKLNQEASDLRGNAPTATEIEKAEGMNPRREAEPKPAESSLSSELAQLDLEDQAAGNKQIEQTPSEKQPGADQAEEKTNPAITDTSPDKKPDNTGNSTSSNGEIEDDPAVYKFPAVIYDYAWMSGCGKGPNGEKQIYSHFSQPDMPPVARIWLFVCPPEVFEERVEGARRGQENEDRFYNAGGGRDANTGDDGEKGAEGN